MQVETIPVLGDNYAYLLICEQTGDAAAVDPADAEAVDARTRELGVRLRGILCTHHHLDHTAGNEALQESRGHGLEVWGHALDRGRIPGLTRPLGHGDTLMVGAIPVRALHTPGHTRGALCYHAQDALFTGDTLFGGGCGRLFERDPPTLYGSLTRVIAPLPPATRVFFGHEYTENNLRFAATVEPGNARLASRLAASRGARTTPSTLQQELETNPFLRAGAEEIRASIQARHPRDELTPLQVFTRLRELRNRW